MSAELKLEELDGVKGSNSASMSGIRKRLEMLLAKELLFVTEMPTLSKFMADEVSVPLDMRVKIREDGSYLGVLKRENDVQEEVLFTVGDSMMEVLVSFEAVLKKARWKESVPWDNS